MLAGAGAQQASQTILVPRRPLTAVVTNLAGGTSGAFSFNVVRDEP